MMKLIFAVTGVTKVSDGKLLVQLAGKHGHVALDLPLGHKITVGQDFVLESDVVSLVEIDEVAERNRSPIPLGPPSPLGLQPPPRFTPEPPNQY